jgi:AraC-like DNA-binding protein
MSRKIKTLTGLTPNKYIREIKLQHARTLLESKKYVTVSEVSQAVGFSKTEYFSQLYKERFGKLPSAYLV